MTIYIYSYIVIYMPSVIVYIRQTDYDKWLAIEKKSEWLHDKLNSGKFVALVDSTTDLQIVSNKSATMAPIKLVSEPFVPRPPDPETGYPCCQASKPCKHWHFNGEQQLWENEITGKTREPGHE